MRRLLRGMALLCGWLLAGCASGDGAMAVPSGAAVHAPSRAASKAVGSAADSAATVCQAPPLGETALYLRGSMNQWQPDEAAEFVYRCDAYYLNLELRGEHRFKIADDRWSGHSIFGNTPGAAAAGLPLRLQRGSGSADLRLGFAGKQALRLAIQGDVAQLSLAAGHFDDQRLRPISDAVALSLRHDSRALADKQPFGAVPAGSTVSLGFSALPGVEQATLVIERRHLEGDQKLLDYAPLARLKLQRSSADSAGRERFSAAYRLDAIGVYGYWFELRIAGQTYALQNNGDTIPWTREKGSNGQAQVGWLQASARHLRRLRLSVYQPDFKTPDWAADAVYYYVFPERFRNGDKRNDPLPGSRRYQNHDVERHARWLSLPYKPGSGDGSDAVYNNDFFGGDLAGLIDKLADIRDLGVNTLYLTPVFAAASNHRYDTADFHRIDPALGSNADFERLTREAARHGLRVIVDTSLNHTGSDSIYFDRFGNHARGPDGRPNTGAFANGRIQAQSPWASWYRLDGTQTDPDKQYSGWAGVVDLPELDKDAPAWRDFAYRAPDSVTRRWLQAGAAGWRMDVAPFVPDDFWREWRAVVKQTDPQAITIAETWFDASHHLLGDMFDATMNYIFRSVVLDYVAGGAASAAVRPLELLRELYPPPAFHALMNLLSSHDQPRALHHFGDTRIGGAPVSAAAVALAKRRLRLALLLQMSYPGAPAVYYGDEVGLTGGDDPYNRAPYPWPDEGGEPDMALRADVKQMITLRQAHPVLRRGTLLAPLHADDAVLVLARRLGEGATARWAITAFNNSDSERSVSVDLPAGAPNGRWLAAWGHDAPAASGGRLGLRLPALGGLVLLSP